MQVVDLVKGSADALFQSVEVDRLAIAVVDEYPYTISLDEPKTELAQDGTIALQMRIERTADFNGPIDVTVPFLPPWVDGPDKISIPADQSTAVYTARAFPQAEPRTWRLCAEARPASGRRGNRGWMRAARTVGHRGGTDAFCFRAGDGRVVATRYAARCRVTRDGNDRNRCRRTGKRLDGGVPDQAARPIATSDDGDARRIAESDRGRCPIDGLPAMIGSCLVCGEAGTDRSGGIVPQPGVSTYGTHRRAGSVVLCGARRRAQDRTGGRPRRGRRGPSAQPAGGVAPIAETKNQSVDNALNGQ